MENTDISELNYPSELEPESHQIVDDWANRCNYWNSKHQLDIPIRKRREKAKAGLILTGNGLSIRVDKGRLLIKDGNTHYPSKPMSKTYFKGELDIPPRIVLVDGNGSITLDALDWLAEQGVPLIRLKWDGSFLSIATSGGQAADPKLVRWQEETRNDPELRAAFARDVLKKKIVSTLETMEHHMPRSKHWQSAYDSICTQAETLKASPPGTLSDVLGLEGSVANAYFRAWKGVSLEWKGLSKHPVPEEWKRFWSRSALRAVAHVSNRNATHPINAMLNYAYGVLLAQTQIRVIAEGYDPMLGVIHDKSRRLKGRYPAYALDRMEEFRPIADRAVLKLIREETFTGMDFELQSDGVVRLNPELARRIVAAA